MGFYNYQVYQASNLRFDSLLSTTSQALSVGNLTNPTTYYLYDSYFNIINKVLTCPPATPFEVKTNGTCYAACPALYFYNVTSKLCEKTNCTVGQYYNLTDNKCYACLYSCLNCNDNVNCTECSLTMFRTFVNSQCEPISAYF